MSVKKKALDIFLNTFRTILRLLGAKKQQLILLHLHNQFIPKLSIKTEFGKIQFYCPGEIPIWRANTLLIKEPETIEWIDSFPEDSIFWDIGANVGCYSLYCALKSNTNILAFEPSAFNYYLLNRNIEINKMDDRILSICIAFNDTTCIDRFYMADTNVGGALYTFGDKIDWQGNSLCTKFKQGMIGLSIDDFIDKFRPPFPNYIKIDVDGIEHKILDGAKRTICDNRLKSILVELNTENAESYEKSVKLLTESGMNLVERKFVPDGADKKWASIYNHIFIRS